MRNRETVFVNILKSNDLAGYEEVVGHNRVMTREEPK